MVFAGLLHLWHPVDNKAFTDVINLLFPNLVACPLTDLFVAVMVKNEIQRTVLSNIILPTNSASF